MIVTLLDGIKCRISIAAIPDEFVESPGAVRIRFPISGSVNVPTDTHLLGFFGCEDFFVGAWPVLMCFGTLLRSFISYHNNNDHDDAETTDNPCPDVDIRIPTVSFLLKPMT